MLKRDPNATPSAGATTPPGTLLEELCYYGLCKPNTGRLVVTLNTPRRVSGGYLVDVKPIAEVSPIWGRASYQACLCNLHLPSLAEE